MAATPDYTGEKKLTELAELHMQHSDFTGR